MRNYQLWLATALVTLPAYSVLAQQPGQEASLPKVEQTSNPVFECSKDTGSRHDHGLEKGTGPAGKRPCSDGRPPKAESAEEPTRPAMRGHDHGKFHKGQ